MISRRLNRVQTERLNVWSRHYVLENENEHLVVPKCRTRSRTNDVVRNRLWSGFSWIVQNSRRRVSHGNIHVAENPWRDEVRKTSKPSIENKLMIDSRDFLRGRYDVSRHTPKKDARSRFLTTFRVVGVLRFFLNFLAAISILRVRFAVCRLREARTFDRSPTVFCSPWNENVVAGYRRPANNAYERRVSVVNAVTTIEKQSFPDVTEIGFGFGLAGDVRARFSIRFQTTYRTRRALFIAVLSRTQSTARASQCCARRDESSQIRRRERQTEWVSERRTRTHAVYYCVRLRPLLAYIDFYTYTYIYIYI